MKSKHIPLLALTLLSLLVCLGSVALIFSLDQDSETFGEQIQASLSLGLPFAVLLIVLVWLGAGVDHLLARIQNKARRLWVSLGVYLFGPLTFCIVLPALAIVVFTMIISPPSNWEQLPALPSTPVEIVSVDEISLTVRTNSDEYFYCWALAPDTCWQATSQPDEFVVNNGTNNQIEETDILPSRTLRGDVIQRVSVRYLDMGAEVLTHYVILSDGSVWYLREGENDYSNGFLIGLLGSVAVIPALAGLLVIYLGAGVSAIARRFAKRADESTSQA